MTDSDEPDNIIHLPLDLARTMFETEKEALFAALRDGSNACAHLQLRIDAGARTIACRDCEAPIDALDVLKHIAHQRQMDDDWAKTWRREESQARTDLAEIKKDIAKARRQLRAEQGKDAVEQFKADLLDRIARGLDVAMDHGEEYHLPQLDALYQLCVGLVGGNESEKFRRKIKAAMQEIEARRRRKSIQIVKRETA